MPSELLKRVDLKAASLVGITALAIALLNRGGAEELVTDSPSDVGYALVAGVVIGSFLTLLGAPYWWRSDRPRPRVSVALAQAAIAFTLWVLLAWNDGGILGASDAFSGAVALTFLAGAGLVGGFAAVLPVTSALLLAGAVDALFHAHEPCEADPCIGATGSSLILSIPAIAALVLIAILRHLGERVVSTRGTG